MPRDRKVVHKNGTRKHFTPWTWHHARILALLNINTTTPGDHFEWIQYAEAATRAQLQTPWKEDSRAAAKSSRNDGQDERSDGGMVLRGEFVVAWLSLH